MSERNTKEADTKEVISEDAPVSEGVPVIADITPPPEDIDIYHTCPEEIDPVDAPETKPAPEEPVV